jgi:hypothetical protein
MSYNCAGQSSTLRRVFPTSFIHSLGFFCGLDGAGCRTLPPPNWSDHLSCRHWLVPSSRRSNPSNPTCTARQYPVSAYREIASARSIRLARPEGFEPQPSDPKPPGPAEGRRGGALTSANNGSLPLFRSIHHCSKRVPGLRADQSIASPAFRRIPERQGWPGRYSRMRRGLRRRMPGRGRKLQVIAKNR